MVVWERRYNRSISWINRCAGASTGTIHHDSLFDIVRGFMRSTDLLPRMVAGTPESSDPNRRLGGRRSESAYLSPLLDFFLLVALVVPLTIGAVALLIY